MIGVSERAVLYPQGNTASGPNRETGRLIAPAQGVPRVSSHNATDVQTAKPTRLRDITDAADVSHKGDLDWGCRIGCTT